MALRYTLRFPSNFPGPIVAGHVPPELAYLLPGETNWGRESDGAIIARDILREDMIFAAELWRAIKERG